VCSDAIEAGGFLSWVRCAWYLRKFSNVIDACNREVASHCGKQCDLEDCINYLGNAGASDITDAVGKCVRQRDPDAFSKLATSCFTASFSHALGK